MCICVCFKSRMLNPDGMTFFLNRSTTLRGQSVKSRSRFLFVLCNPTWSSSSLMARAEHQTRGDASTEGKRLKPIVVDPAPRFFSNETEDTAQGQAKTLPSLPCQHHQTACLKRGLVPSQRLHCGCRVTGPYWTPHWSPNLVYIPIRPLQRGIEKNVYQFIFAS